MENESLNFVPPEGVVRPFKEERKNWPQILAISLGIILMISAGIFSGYFLVQKGKGKAPEGGKPKIIKTEKMVGSTDIKTFRDSTEGVLEKGGLDGEGSHKLIRPGGESQTAYLTSSIVDLDQFVGKKVRVWGETFKAQKAGWLMDVGKIELLE